MPLWALAGFSSPFPLPLPSLPGFFPAGAQRSSVLPGEKACGELSPLTAGFLGAAERWKRPLGPCCLITLDLALFGGNWVTHSSLSAALLAGTGCVVRQSWIQMLLLLPSGELGFWSLFAHLRGGIVITVWRVRAMPNTLCPPHAWPSTAALKLPVLVCQVIVSYA